MLVVDNVGTERNIRRVFSQKLLGTAQFWSKGEAGKQYKEEGESGGLKDVCQGALEEDGAVSGSISWYLV